MFFQNPKKCDFLGFFAGTFLKKRKTHPSFRIIRSKIIRHSLYMYTYSIILKLLIIIYMILVTA